MPQRPRTRPNTPLAVGLALTVLLVTPGCEPEPTQGDEGRGQTGASTPPEPTRLQQLADQTPRERVASVRRFLFGDGRGLDRIGLRVVRGELEWDLLVGHDRALRIHETDGTNLLRTGGEDTAWSGLGRAAEPATKAEVERIDDWEFLLDALLLRPFADLSEVRCDELHTLNARGASGRELAWTLNDDALPTAVSIDGRTLRIDAHVATGTGAFPSEVSDERLGSCRVRVVGHAILFDSTTFEPPKASDLREVRNEKQESKTEGVVGKVERATAWLLLVPDPGSWNERFEALSNAGRRLSAVGDVRPTEDAALVERGGAAYVQIAFTGTFEEADLALESDERLLERSACRALQIEVPPGLWADRIVDAERRLREKLGEDGDPEEGIELLFNHVTRTGLADDPSSRRTMIVHLRAALR